MNKSSLYDFLPNKLFWVEIIALSLAHSVFIAYFICYMLNDFKFYPWLSIGICLFLLGMYYIVFLNLFNTFKKDSFEEESHSNKLLLASGTYFTKPLLILSIFGFGYFVVKNWNMIKDSNLYKLSILGLLLLVGLILFIWRYSFPLEDTNKDCHMKFPFHAVFHLLGGFTLTFFYTIINHFE